MTPAQLQQLELLIDATSLIKVLQGIAEIAALKAAYMADTWQDQFGAIGWNAAGATIKRTANRLQQII